ncbi:MAG TPA: 50S ribosomal protein L10 [Firmicutes bacterium]|nr:50S ribosomal protein L10 [Bacillota bacterium]
MSPTPFWWESDCEIPFFAPCGRGGNDLPTPEKEAVVKEIQERLERGKAMIVAEYRGLNVQKITQLRRSAREAGVEFKVYKNTLMARAATALGITGLQKYLEGPNAFAFSYEDPVAAAKVLAEFTKNNEELQLKCGLLEGKVISVDEVKSLAELPPREVLLASLLRGMQAPLSGLVNVLQGNIRKLVYVLSAIQEKKEAAGA